MLTAAQAHRNIYIKKTIGTLIPTLILTIGIAVGVTNLGSVREFFIGATGDEANIQVDTQAILGPMPRPWRNLAQGGEDKNWRLQPLTQQVKALKPEYIRIDHIYDFYDVVSRGPSGLQFNWAKMDPVISDILAVGAKPYISMSYLPPAIAPNGDIVGQPPNWNEWQVIVQKTVEHFSKQRGIEDVVYEVWNEPDLFGKWKAGGSKNYMTLYIYSSRGAQQAMANGTKAFKLGGPAITALYENWVKQLLDVAAKQNLKLDFISWHRYNRDIDVYRKDFAQAKEWIAANPQFSNIELHVTEWGHDSEIDPGYDGAFGAAHTAAVATEMVGQIQRGFVFEIQDGRSGDGKEYWGRWGLFTHQDFGAKAKPRYRALKFIDDNIGAQRVSILGKGTWVKAMAARSGDATTVVLTNYDSAGRHNENVPITFKSLIGSNFAVDTIFMDGRNNRTEVSTTSAELKVVVSMPVNTVAAVRLVPLSAQVEVVELTSQPVVTPTSQPTQSPEITSTPITQ